MKRGPSVIAQIILGTTELDAAPASLVDIATRIIMDNGWESHISAAREKAELWESGILIRLQSEISALAVIGRPPRIAFNSSSEYMIQGACFVEPRDSTELRDKKARRSRSLDYYQALGDLSPRQFEILCGKLIELLGVHNPTVTRSTIDEGIDFYGQLSLESVFFPHDLTPTIQKQLSIWLVGQAKHYKRVQSGTSEIRDLVGAISLGRAYAFGSVENPFADLKIRAADPVFAVLITTGTLSANAWRLLQKSGVIGMDGEMLATFLADREAGLSSVNFDHTNFLTWLES